MLYYPLHMNSEAQVSEAAKKRPDLGYEWLKKAEANHWTVPQNSGSNKAASEFSYASRTSLMPE